MRKYLHQGPRRVTIIKGVNKSHDSSLKKEKEKVSYSYNADQVPRGSVADPYHIDTDPGPGF